MSEPTEDRGYEQSARFYDLFDRKANLEFFYHYAARGQAALDVGAGTGRIAIPLAERGVQVCCIEPSPDMRAQFEQKIAREPLLKERIRIIPGEAHNFNVSETFPCAYLSGTYDHFLDDEVRLESLTNIARHLRPNGVLVFDVFLRLMAETPLSPAGKAVLGDGRQVQRFVGGKVLPGKRKVTYLVFEVYENGELIKRIEERSMVGITTREEIHRALAQVGFEVRQEWGNYDFTTFKQGNKLLIVEAVKRASPSPNP
jgi:FkbM family methyltransferase